MKNIYIILFFTALNNFNSNAQSPDWLWAKSAGGTDDESGRSISTDANGNVLVTGTFSSPAINFGATTLTNTSVGSADMFVVKYDASGNVIWAKSAGGTSTDEGIDISTDANGNVLVTGAFDSPSIIFDSITLINVSPGFDDVFVVKYNASGTVQWARSAGGPSFDIGFGISTDATGNVYVTGDFFGPSITFGITTLTNSGSADYFIVKYNSSGIVVWTKSAGGIHYDHGIGISTDATGNVLVNGYFQSSAITFGTVTLTNSGSTSTSDIFIVKYDISGNVLWAKSASGTSNEFGSGVSTDGSGNSMLTGFYTSDTLTFGTTAITNSGSSTYREFFIVKYDSSGNVIWANSAGGTFHDGGSAISIDSNGNALAIGYFDSPSIIFGTNVLTNTDSTGSTSDVFIVKYDTSGNLLWAKSIGGPFYDNGNGIYAGTNDNVLVTGNFSNVSIDFGTITLVNAGNTDIYVAKLDTTTFTGIAEENDLIDSFTIYPNPTTDQIAIESTTIINEIKIINLSGQIIYHSKPKKKHLSMQVEEAGTYFIQIISKNQVVTKKVLVYK